MTELHTLVRWLIEAMNATTFYGPNSVDHIISWFGAATFVYLSMLHTRAKWTIARPGFRRLAKVGAVACAKPVVVGVPLYALFGLVMATPATTAPWPTPVVAPISVPTATYSCGSV